MSIEMSMTVPQSQYVVPRWAQYKSSREFVAAHGNVAMLTVVRLTLVPIFVLSFFRDPYITGAALALFIVADVYDGVLARHYDADGPHRRALDSVVDRVGIDAFFLGAYFAGALPLTLLVAFLLRDLYCALVCGAMMRARTVAIKADWLYRSLNLSVAAWAVAAPYLSHGLRSVTIATVLVFSIYVAIDLTRSVRRVLHSDPAVRNRVLPAGDLRALRLG